MQICWVCLKKVTFPSIPSSHSVLKREDTNMKFYIFFIFRSTYIQKDTGKSWKKLKMFKEIFKN